MAYAIIFDLKTEELEKHYGEAYNGAYDEIEKELGTFGFKRSCGNLYIEKNDSNNLAHLYQAIRRLSAMKWFRKSVGDVTAFKVEDWSDFTNIVRNS